MSSKQSIFFFRFKPKLNLFWLFFSLFRETKKHFFRFVSVFRTGIETTQTNRTLSKQTKSNQKNLQKMFSIRGSSKQLKFFSRFKPKQTETQSVLVVFRFVFSQNQKFFSGLFRFVLVCFGLFWFVSVCFGLFHCFGTVLKQPKKPKLQYGMGNLKG